MLNKSNRSGLFRLSALLLMTVFLLTSILTACESSPSQEDDEILPVIFIPGVQGSELVAQKDSRVLWPPGGQTGNVGLTDIPAIRDDFYRLSLSPASAHESVYPSDVIRRYGKDAVYSLFLEFLTKNGYVEYKVEGKPERRTVSGAFMDQKPKPSLFVFAYDWRLSIEENSGTLSEYVEVVEKYYPGKKVNIVTHSMGGLVARRYIIDHPGKVNKLVTIAAPFLGSPKPLFQMIYGKLNAPASYGSEAAWASITDTLTGGGPFGEGPITGMLSYFPSVHELMSSEAYFALGGPPYTVVEPGVLSNLGVPGMGNTKALSFEEFMGPNGKVDQLFPNPGRVAGTLKTAAKANRDFHAYSTRGNNQDDWSNDTTSVKYFHLIGVQDSNDTVLSLREAMPGSLTFQVRDYAMNDFGPGDGTVPFLSAARIGTGRNLNASNARLFIYTGGKIDLTQDYSAIVNHPSVTMFTGNPDAQTEHTGIMTNSKVMAKVLELLRDEKAADKEAGVWLLSETEVYPPEDSRGGVANAFGDVTKLDISDTGLAQTWKVAARPGRTVGGIPAPDTPGYELTHSWTFNRPPESLTPGELITITINGNISGSGAVPTSGGAVTQTAAMLAMTIFNPDAVVYKQGEVPSRDLWQQGVGDKRLTVTMGSPVSESFSFIVPKRETPTQIIIIEIRAGPGWVKWVYKQG